MKYAVPDNIGGWHIQFGGREAAALSWDEAGVIFMPVPYEGTVTYKKGTRLGPCAILEASANMELFDEELERETFRTGFLTVPPLCQGGEKPDAIRTIVREATGAVLSAHKFPVILGGEHSVSIGAVDAVADCCEDALVIHFDAHYDLRDSYEGSTLNHACVARRIQEKLPLVQIGVRSLSKEEHDFLQTHPPRITQCVNADRILRHPGAWQKEFEPLQGRKVYLSIDVDVFDPSLIPSTGTPEPGGISWNQMLAILRAIIYNTQVIGCDIVELAPVPGNIAPDFMVSKLLYRILGYRQDAAGKPKVPH